MYVVNAYITYVCVLVFVDAGCYKPAIKQHSENYITVATYAVQFDLSSSENRMC